MSGSKWKSSIVNQLGNFSTHFVIAAFIFFLAMCIGIYIVGDDRALEHHIASQITSKDSALKITALGYFKKNIIVFHLIIIGSLSFSLISLLILALNGVIIGYSFGMALINSGSFTKALLLLLPHFSEYIGFMIATGLSTYLLFLVVQRGNLDFVREELVKLLKIYSLGFVMVVFAAVMEAYVTILFL